MNGLQNKFDWDDLKLFHALVSTGSMSAAARTLGIGQPTVSRRLETLETRIGARLVTRGTTGVELTDIGESIWGLVKTMQNTAEDIERLAYQADRAQEGTVKLAAPDGISAYWLASHLSMFVEANPMINLRMQSRYDTEDLMDGRTDLAIQLVKPDRPKTVDEELATLHYVPFTSRSYIETYGIPKGLGEALNHRIGDLTAYRDRGAWPAEAAAIKKMMKPALIAEASSTLIEATKHGAVISMLPTYMAKMAPELIHLDMDLHVSLPLRLVYYSEQRNVTRVRKAMDWIKEIFNPDTHDWFRRDFIPPSEFSNIETIRAYGARPVPREVL